MCLTIMGLLKHFNQKTLSVLFIKQSLKYSHFSTKYIDETKFIPIYKFPYIRVIHAINKLKIYQGIGATIGISLSGVLQSVGLIDTNYLPIAAAIGITGTVTLTILGKLTENFIGFMYISENGTIMRISYLDFWAKRKNVNIPIDDIVPLSEIPNSLTDKLYLKLKRYSNKDVYKINLKQGEVLNWECIEQILGKLEQK